MTTRLLPVAEWPKLAGTELAAVYPYLTPDSSAVLVVEDGDRILGCWSLFPAWHVEGVWIHPDHRGRASVARRLLTGMRRLLKTRAIRGVFTGAADPTVARYLTTLGAVPLPPCYAWAVSKES